MIDSDTAPALAGLGVAMIASGIIRAAIIRRRAKQSDTHLPTDLNSHDSQAALAEINKP